MLRAHLLLTVMVLVFLIHGAHSRLPPKPKRHVAMGPITRAQTKQAEAAQALFTAQDDTRARSETAHPIPPENTEEEPEDDYFAVFPERLRTMFNHMLNNMYRREVSAMFAVKAAAFANGPCSGGTPKIRSTKDGLLATVEQTLPCIPSFSKDKGHAAGILAGEAWTAAQLALAGGPQLGTAYFGLSTVYWLGAGPLRRSLLGDKASNDILTNEYPGRDELLQDLCRLQLRLIEGPHMQPPTFFEFLGLDAARYPFFPAGRCAASTNENHAAAIDSITSAHIKKQHRITKAYGMMGSRLGVLDAVTASLLNDTARAAYMVFFLPLVMGKDLEVDNNIAINRQEVLAYFCELHG